MSPVYEGPVDRIPFKRPLHQWTTTRGRTVYRKGGVWVETSDPLYSEIEQSDVVAAADRPGGERFVHDKDTLCFLGGRRYTISSAVATVLTAAGYGAYIT